MVRPGAVRDAWAEAVSATELAVSWRAPLAAADAELVSYEVLVDNTLFQSSTARTEATRHTTAVVGGLDPFTTYSVAVRARGELGGLGDYSAPVSATTLAAVPGAAPLDLVLTADSHATLGQSARSSHTHADTVTSRVCDVQWRAGTRLGRVT